MKSLRVGLAFFALISGPALFARALSGQCEVDFRGDSTLHDFEGRVRSQPFKVDVVRSEDGSERWSVALAVRSGEMDTQHRKRDRNMRAMLRVADFPIIEGAVTSADPAPYRRRADAPPLPLSLTIVGRQNPLQAAVQNWQEDEREIRFDVAFPVSLKQFGLKPPSVMGIIRVDDRVDVTCHVVLLKD